MKGYAYVDNSKVMHLVAQFNGEKDQINDIKERAIGKVILTNDFDFKFGYPVDEKGRQIVIYSTKECYIDGNRAGGDKLNTASYFPELAALYARLV